MVVYINMEMPEDGRYTLCITHDSSGDVHWVFQNTDTYEFLKHGRVEEIPPHGDLIDANKLVELCDIMADKCDGIGVSVWHQFKTAVEWSPIVIPAEDGE